MELSESKKKLSPLKVIMDKMNSGKLPVKLIPKERILRVSPPEMSSIDNGLNIANSSLTININIDGKGVQKTIEDVSSKISSGMAVLGGMAAAALFINGVNQLENDPNSLERRSSRVKLPPLPIIKLPKI